MLLSSAFVTLRHHGHHPGRNQSEFQSLLPGTSSSSIPKPSLPCRAAPCSWRLVQAGRAWSVSLGGGSCNSQILRRTGLSAGARSSWECLPAPSGTSSASAARSAEELREPWTDSSPDCSSGSAPALLPELLSACLLGIGDPVQGMVWD